MENEKSKQYQIDIGPLSRHYVGNENCGDNAHQIQSKLQEIEIILLELLGLDEHYQILIYNKTQDMQRNIFSLLSVSGDTRAAFLDSGSRSNEAILSARKFLEVEVIASSRESAYSYVPSCEWIPYNVSFIHLTSTNEMQGNRLTKFPKVALPLLCDASADLFSALLPLSEFSITYANGGNEFLPEDLMLLIVKKTYMHKAGLDSFRNKNPVHHKNHYAGVSFMSLFVFHHHLSALSKNGGIPGQAAVVEKRAQILYREIERNTRFHAVVNPKDRSPLSLRFYVSQSADRYRFVLALDKQNSHIVEWSEHGDFLVSTIRSSDEEILQLVEIMQRFELESSKPGNDVR